MGSVTFKEVTTGGVRIGVPTRTIGGYEWSPDSLKVSFLPYLPPTRKRKLTFLKLISLYKSYIFHLQMKFYSGELGIFDNGKKSESEVSVHAEERDSLFIPNPLELLPRFFVNMWRT